MRDEALMAEWITMQQTFNRLEVGAEPSEAQLAAAPRLEQWQLRPHRVGKLHVLRADGAVHGHARYFDGNWIRTSDVIWVDRRLRFVLTQNRLYVLGEHAGDEVPVDGVDV